VRWTKRQLNPRMWHRWFAWYPVRVTDLTIHENLGSGTYFYGDYVWCQWVERKLMGQYSTVDALYRLPRQEAG